MLSARLARNIHPHSSSAGGLSWAVRIYIAGLTIFGFILLLNHPLLPIDDPIGLLLFVLLIALAQLLPIGFYKNVSTSLILSVGLASIMVMGHAYVGWVNIAWGLIHYFTETRPKHRPFYRSLVPTAALIVAAWSAGEIYVAAGGSMDASAGHAGILSYAGPFAIVTLAGLTYYVIHLLLSTFPRWLEHEGGFFELMSIGSEWLILNLATLSPLAIGLQMLYERIGVTGLCIYVAPIVITRYSFQRYSRSTERVHRVNAQLQEANAQVSESIAELKQANERLNIMYEISRMLAGSLHVVKVVEQVETAARLIGFPAAFIAGPLPTFKEMDEYWRIAHKLCERWGLPPPDDVSAALWNGRINALVDGPWFAMNSPHVLRAADWGLPEPSSDAPEAGLGVITFVPLYVQDHAWGILGLGSREAPSTIQFKEVMILSTMTGNALETALVHEQSERDALMDARTGLYNHRYFQEAVQQHLQECARRNESLSLLMIDIDRFKQLNDEFGHLTGDMVLQTLGKILRDSVRQSDIACRYGGDEMAILLPNTERKAATDLANRIHTAVRKHTLYFQRGEEQMEIRVGLSIGVASFPEVASTRASLVEMADRACYRAKRSGGGVAAESRPLGSTASNSSAPTIRF